MGSERYLGGILVERGLLTAEALETALQAQRGTGRRIGDVLMEMGQLGEEALRWALAEQMDLPLVHPDPAALDPAALGMLPADLCRRYRILPLYLAEERPGGPHVLTVAAADPAARELLDDVAARVGCPLRVVAALREEILSALDAIYGTAGDADVAVHAPEMDALTAQRVVEDPTGGVLWNYLLARVAERGEGGLHLKARGGETRIEDLDGAVLFSGGETWYAILLDRVRRMAGIRQAAGVSAVQRGRVAFRGQGAEPALFRLSILVGVEGEEAQLRMVPREERSRSLEELGLLPGQVEQIRRALERPGLVWVTALAEEGLGSTLFGLLREIPGDGRTVTVEREVFYRSEDLLQVETLNLDAEGRSDVLRELRHLACDRVMVDRVSPSQLGDLLALSLGRRWVAAGTPEADLKGILRALAAQAADVPLYGLRLIVHQRLVPLLCTACRAEVALASAEQERLRGVVEPSATLYQEGDGCPQCGGRGVRGLRAMFEVLPVDAAVRDGLYAEGRGQARIDEILGRLVPSLRQQVAEAAGRGEVGLAELWEVL